MMASATEIKSDEEYLLSRILSYLKTDRISAKSWMIFSKSVFPQSFLVLFQAYKMELEEKNATESAICLSDLIRKFPNETILIKELQSIADALSSDSNDFFKAMFENLPEDVKYEMMIVVRRNAHSIEEHCRMMLFFMKNMSDAILLQISSNIIETLLSAENASGACAPVNLFRKMLVCDALPLVLKVPLYDPKFKLIFPLLQKAIEFYVTCIFTDPHAKDNAIKKDATAFYESNAENGWRSLLTLFGLVALRCNWNNPEVFVSKFSELGFQQHILLLKKKNKLLFALTNEKHRQEEASGFDEAYFCLVLSFFYYLYNFGRLIHPNMYADVVKGEYNYVLMEGIPFLPDDCPKKVPNDFKSTNHGYLVVSKSGLHDSNLLSSSFLTVVECWELLHRHQHLTKEFTSVCTNIKLETWPVFQEFFINSLIFEKEHKDALQYLSRIRDSVVDRPERNKIDLQIASSYFQLKDYAFSVKILIDIIVNLSPVNSFNPVKSCISKCPTRFTYFMAYNNSDILQYCVNMLLKLYKSKDIIDNSYKDLALGYMLILMQYNLENEYKMLQKCIEAIKKAKTFCFPNFFKYVIHVVILEEIAYLAAPHGGNVSLEILPTSAYQACKQRTVTRGINKEAKDELKQAFFNQMSRCYDNLDNLLIDFFKEEHSLLLLSLGL